MVNIIKQRGSRLLPSSGAPATRPPPTGIIVSIGNNVLGNEHTAVNKKTPHRRASYKCCRSSQRNEPSEATCACSVLLCPPFLMSEGTVTDGLPFPASHSQRNGPIQDPSYYTQHWMWLPLPRGPGAPGPPPFPSELLTTAPPEQRKGTEHALRAGQWKENEQRWKWGGGVRSPAADSHPCTPPDFTDISRLLLSPVRGPSISQSPGIPGT